MPMNKPLLLIITGRPASGKTTLAHLLSGAIKLPLVSRDELKEGYVNTTGTNHDILDNSVDKHIYETFFLTITLLIEKGVSVIAEAAFQHKLWQPKLAELTGKTAIKIIICETGAALAKTRFINRLANDPDRGIFHGDNAIYSAGEKITSLIDAYETVDMQVPVLHVDTTSNYTPGIETIIDFIKQ
ncbi:MAG TPA: AAA family ATPase [Chitinophagaceae bacterium]|nr:AAA family ATPase [Chitinophagaceae bacterium]